MVAQHGDGSGIPEDLFRSCSQNGYTAGGRTMVGLRTTGQGARCAAPPRYEALKAWIITLCSPLALATAGLSLTG